MSVTIREKKCKRAAPATQRRFFHSFFTGKCAFFFLNKIARYSSNEPAGSPAHTFLTQITYHFKTRLTGDTLLVGSVWHVTTAGFVSDQFIGNKQQFLDCVKMITSLRNIIR